MDTAIRESQNYMHDNQRLLTFPIFFLLVYLVCIYFPHVYNIFPFLRHKKIVLLAGILLLISYLFTCDRYHNITAYKHPIFLAWVVLLFIMPFGLIYSMDRGITKAFIEASYKYFLIFMIMIKIIDSAKRLNLIMGIFALCGVGMALGSLFWGMVSARGRTMSIQAGLFADPNDLCFLLNCTLPFLLFILLKSKRKLLPLAGIIVVITAIVLTFSRGGFLGLCMAGFGFTLFIARKSKKYLFFVLTAAVLVWSYAPTAYKERIATITDWRYDKKTGLTGTRMDSWLPAVKWGLQHPITGQGAGATLYFNGMTRHDWHVTHNSFVQILAGTGIIGFASYIMLFIIPFRQFTTLIRQNAFLSNEDMLRMRTIMISFFTYATTAFFLPQGYSPILYLLTGLYLIQAQLIFKSTALGMFLQNES